MTKMTKSVPFPSNDENDEERPLFLAGPVHVEVQVNDRVNVND
jgi:hypothetical protein